MTGYIRQIEQIETAQTLDELRDIARTFPAQARGEGGILYSGRIGNVSTEVIAKEFARKTGLSIINDTPRAQFLSDSGVERAIRGSTERILKGNGASLSQIEKAKADFLYGDGKLPPESPLSVKNSLWGEASGEFARSVRGHVVVVASAANVERVLAQVELPAVLHVNQAKSLGGHSLPELQALQAQGGMQSVLPEVQASFVDASTKGIFIGPDMSGKSITQVAISREVATTLHMDSSNFIGAKALSEAGFVPAPLTPSAAMAETATAAEHVSGPTLAMGGAAARSGLSPHLVRGASALGAAAFAIDATRTAGHSFDLLQQGNRTGAASAIEHFGARNLGAWGGAVLGAQVFGTAGAETGPVDLVIGGAGAIVGAVAGDKLLDAYDNHKIYHQTDPQGTSWQYDPKQPQQGWTRTVVDTFAERGLSHTHVDTAPPAVAQRLTFQANSTAVELALAHPGTPRDPWTQPAGPHDRPSHQEASWTRDAQTHRWSRTVTEQVMEHGLKSTHVDMASPARAAELDAAVQRAILENLANSPRGIAERYQALYAQNGWATYGPMPESVTGALKAPADTLEASDGHTYTRGRDGQWITPGLLWGTNAAAGPVRQELDATRALEQPVARPSTDAQVSASPYPHTPAIVPTASGYARNDPRHPDSADHGLYRELRERIPQASEKRLLQFTAACHVGGITQENIGRITFDEQRGVMHFMAAGAFRPSVAVDVTTPSPEPQQSIRHIQQHDEQQAQWQAQFQAQQAQINTQARQGPSMGGPGF